jgi:xanthine dehydrogenase accessory factor
MKASLLAALNVERAARRACVLVTDVATGEQRLVLAPDVERDPLATQLDAALRVGKSSTIEVDGKSLFLTVQVPPARLLIVGAVHVAQVLSTMAKLTDFDVTIVDPRTAFATPERFPDGNVIAEWPDDAIPRIGLDRYTAVAALTHDPKVDDPALSLALSQDCFYIGALGSRKTHAKRVERLKAAGFSDEKIARIHAPIGLDIGAVSPAEIAVSILGEIVLSLRKKPLRVARERAA